MGTNAKKTAFLFSGQGVSSSIICEHYKYLRNIDKGRVEKFIKILQNSLNEINPREKINIEESLASESLNSWRSTSFIQPITYTLSILTFYFIREKKEIDFIPRFVLGHSLGAFSSLTAAGCMSFEQGCEVVSARGKFMQEESEKADNGMIAIIGLTQDKIVEICKKTNALIALINAPTALVVGCPRNIFSQVEQEASLMGAAKTIRLSTSGAFHTTAMQGAYKKFKAFFDKYAFAQAKAPVVSNMTGKASTDISDLKYDCIESMINPINWVRMMKFLKENNVRYYIETGPGTSLSSLCSMNDIGKERIIHARTILK